jgi:hypothetical protein
MGGKGDRFKATGLTEAEAEATLVQIETTSDLTRILRLAVYKRNGVPFETLERLGLPTPEPAVVELRRRGYELEVIGTGGARRVKLKAEPKVGNARRKRRQMTLLDPPKAA